MRKTQVIRESMLTDIDSYTSGVGVSASHQFIVPIGKRWNIRGISVVGLVSCDLSFGVQTLGPFPDSLTLDLEIATTQIYWQPSSIFILPGEWGIWLRMDNAVAGRLYARILYEETDEY